MNRPHLLFLLLLTLAQAPSWAQQEALGRLFFTPQERAALDRQRRHNPSVDASPMDSDVSQTINGEVRRSSGRSTRWINGEANWGETAPKPHVPVGDTFHPATGEHQSVLGAGKIIVKPAPRAPQ